MLALVLQTKVRPMAPLILLIVRLLLALLSVGGIFAGVFMMGDGFKGEPVNSELGTQGFLLMLGSLFLFPSKQHILYRLWLNRKSNHPVMPPETLAPSNTRPTASGPVKLARPSAIIPARIGRSPELYDGRVRLDFVVPPPNLDRATSWIGGLPKLPADVKWPNTTGNPFLFVAQIAMADLPANIWGGHGPKSGSLAFFVDNESHFQKVKVLHVDGKLADRPYPGMVMGDVSYPILRRSLSGGRQAVSPDPDAVPLTKWPVRITPIDQTADLPKPYFKYRDPNNAAALRHKSLSLSEPALMPYNWETLIEFLTTVISQLNGSVQDERRAGAVSDPQLENQAERTEIAKTLATRRDSLKKRAKASDFSLAEWDKIVDLLSDIQIRPLRRTINPSTRKAELTAQPPEPVLNSFPVEKYFSTFEYLSRQLYATNPGLLPQPVRALLEPIWQHDAAFEVASMGGQIDSAGYVTASRSDLVCLLEVPCSELVGAVWHDLSSFGVFISPESLAKGQFEDAVGEVTES